MQQLREQYIGEYRSALEKLQEAYEQDWLDELIEIRRTLNELMAIACRSLSDRDSRLFKSTCEEIEENFIVQ